MNWVNKPLQSEGRIHRVGTKDAQICIGAVATVSIDSKIVSNLRGKKSLSELALDDKRKPVNELG